MIANTKFSVSNTKPTHPFENLLFQGDNLIVLDKLLSDYHLKGKIDLVYIYPPYSTQNLFTIDENRASTISRSTHGKIAYSDKIVGNEFLDFIRQRLVLIKELLSNQGSIYLHIDTKIGHYVKLVMDEVFGMDNFRNDITRIKCNPKNFARKGFGNIKDLILFYSKSSELIWNEPLTPYSEIDKSVLFPKVDNKGRRYTTIPLHAPGETQNGATSLPFKGIFPPKGRHWRTNVQTLEEWDVLGLIEWSENGNPRKKIFLDEQVGKRIQDIWEFKDPQYPVYPTEKNADMLDLIIKTSSNPHSYVLDCFCGSGTTLASAQKNGRYWIGVDASEEAISATQNKLASLKANLFETEATYRFENMVKLG